MSGVEYGAHLGFTSDNSEILIQVIRQQIRVIASKGIFLKISDSTRLDLVQQM